jgi:rhamnogalacturonyl hydrolase YesR
MSTGEILEMLPKLEPAERRAILDRLCELEQTDAAGLHQQWVDEALASGPACEASASDWEGALQRGLNRGTQA